MLDPLLFLILIYDLPKTVPTSLSYLLADGSKFHSVLTTSDMQHDINGFLYWSGENLKRFNFDKCNVISFENREPIGPFFLDGNELPVVNTIKDLGIMVSDNLFWDKHIQTKLIAARKSFQFLKRNLPRIVCTRTKLLYCRLCVLSLLLFGSQIWYLSSIY